MTRVVPNSEQKPLPADPMSALDPSLLALAARLYPEDTERQATLKLCKRLQASDQRTIDFYTADKSRSPEEDFLLKASREALQRVTAILADYDGVPHDDTHKELSRQGAKQSIAAEFGEEAALINNRV